MQPASLLQMGEKKNKEIIGAKGCRNSRAQNTYSGYQGLLSCLDISPLKNGVRFYFIFNVNKKT